jgi:hypothetical protein
MTTRLVLDGVLTRNPGLGFYHWQTSGGIEVRVDGERVNVRWTTSHDVSAAFALMQSEVEDRLLLECLDTAMPVELQWLAHSELIGSRTVTVNAPTVTVGWNPRRPWRPLDSHDPRRAVTSREEVRVAINHFRRAILAWGGDMRETMSRLYLASEVLALDLTGDSAQSDWGTLAQQVGMTSTEGLQLYCSLQFGRHMKATRALDKLADLGVEQLNPAECLDKTRRLILAYIAHRVSNP